MPPLSAAYLALNINLRFPSQVRNNRSMRVACLITSFTPNFHCSSSSPTWRARIIDGPFVMGTYEGVVQVDLEIRIFKMQESGSKHPPLVEKYNSKDQIEAFHVGEYVCI